MRIVHIFLICLLFLTFCARKLENEADSEHVNIDPLRLQAAQIVSSMNNRLLAAQTIISGIDGREYLSSNMIELLTEIPTGGIMLFRYNLNADNETIRSFLGETSSLIGVECGIYPFFAVDHEGGRVTRFRHDVASLPSAFSYWELYQSEGIDVALEKIEEDSFKAGLELNWFGINMNFAPVAEHTIDENRVFLQTRSYGPDPYFAAKASTAFMRGMELAGIICVVKHFPGNAGPDPHFSASVLDVDRTALDILISPFLYNINNGARAMMAAHTLVPLIDNKIASFSSVKMGDWLRGELGFNGIIISDDFLMAAVGNISPEEAAVRSIIAGSDMILVWPAYLKKTYEAITAALEDGRLSQERLQDAAQRIIYEKLKMGLML